MIPARLIQRLPNLRPYFQEVGQAMFLANEPTGDVERYYDRELPEAAKIATAYLAIAEKEAGQ